MCVYVCINFMNYNLCSEHIVDAHTSAASKLDHVACFRQRDIGKDSTEGKNGTIKYSFFLL